MNHTISFRYKGNTLPANVLQYIQEYMPGGKIDSFDTSIDFLLN